MRASLLHEPQCFEESQRLPDASFQRLQTVNAKLSTAHRELFRRRPVFKFPETIHCASYQDGLHHALDRAANLAHTGSYSHRCRLRHMMQSYGSIRREKLTRRKYHDVAYIDGYVNRLILLATDEDTSRYIPLFYVFGAKDQPRTFAAYQRLANNRPRLHRAAYLQARRLADDLPEPGADPKKLEFHHTPFLL